MKTKRKMLHIHLFETDAIVAYLEDMAKKGWILKKFSYGWLKFKKEEPQELYYVMDIIDGGSYMNPYHIDEKQKEYGEFMEDFGYEIVAKTSNYQLYCLKQQPTVDMLSEADEATLKRKESVIKKYEAVNYLMYLLLAAVLGLSAFGRWNQFYTYISNAAIVTQLLLTLMPLLFLYLAGPSVYWFIRRKTSDSNYHRLLRRERIVNVVLLLFVLMVAVSLTASSFGFMAIIGLMTMFFMLCLFYILDTILAHFMKRFHGLLAILIACYLMILLPMQFLHLELNFSKAPSTVTANPITNVFKTLYKDEKNQVGTAEEVEDSIALTTYSFYDNYSLNDDWSSYSYEIYLIKGNTPLHRHVRELLLDENRVDESSMQEYKGWRVDRKRSDGRTYLLNGNVLIQLELKPGSDEQLDAMIQAMDRLNLERKLRS